MTTGPGEEPVPSIFDEDPDQELQQRDRELRRMRSVLLSSGILIVLPALVGHFRLHSFATPATLLFAVAALTVVGVYAALGAYAMRRPFTALVAGLGIYLLMQLAVVASGAVEPFTAWIFRALVVLNLLMPIQRARQLQHGPRA